MQSVDETLAKLRVLLWVAQADGAIQPWEKTVLNQVLQAIYPPEKGEDGMPITLDSILSEPFSVEQALSVLRSPDLQQTTYEEALAIAQLDGLTPAEEKRLAYLRKAFHLQNTILQSTATEEGAAEFTVGLDWSDTTVSGRGIVLGMRRLINHSRQIRSLILDYALGAAIIGVIPLPQLLTIQLLAVLALIFIMLRDIGSRWGFPRGVDGLALVGNLFGFMGACAIAFMAWLSFFGLGLIAPPLRTLTLAAAFASFTWAIGQITNQYYMSSSRLDVTALRRVLQRQSQPRTRRWLPWKT